MKQQVKNVYYFPAHQKIFIITCLSIFTMYYFAHPVSLCVLLYTLNFPSFDVYFKECPIGV